jgi:hypothetical protein
VLPARSLRTRDLAEANRAARTRVGEYEAEIAAKRGQALNGANTDPSHARLSQSTIERMAAAHRRQLLDDDFGLRADAYARAVADPQAFWRGHVLPTALVLQSCNTYRLVYAAAIQRCSDARAQKRTSRRERRRCARCAALIFSTTANCVRGSF